MSRYLILFLLNAPFVIAGMFNAFVHYKLSKSSFRRLVFQVGMWSVLLAGLALAEPIYEFLFSNNLTETEPLSLFDVMQITGIIVLFFITTRSRTKIEVLERRIQDFHQELSIRLADDVPKRRSKL